MKVTNEDFVVAYATSETLEQIANTLKMNKSAVQTRRNFLKNKGVKFPILKSSNAVTMLDVARLNSLILKHDIRRNK